MSAKPSTIMKRAIELNGHHVTVNSRGQTPLLWVLREDLQLTGTKFGCGIGQCGACTVHVESESVRSCVLPLQAVTHRAVTTIEGLTNRVGQALKATWLHHQVAQCGYCQSGMLMAAAALLAARPVPTDPEIDAAVTNLCRCGTYPRVRAAIHDAARLLATGGAA